MVRFEKLDNNEFILIIEKEDGETIKTPISNQIMEQLIRAALSAIAPKITLRNPKTMIGAQP